ncbi:polysaccharide biosynthesis C-terminal domain-containing protein [Levilactobacillus brevis]|uniref:oligosaccharide flippase family protein n=1 Tax=Levilactobacillus brevis TaxID=1580 RepID=UPI000A2FDCD8|nr:polysaccharide biosynthesis C-terminal domain-containing protein [Levilactobacillus brevis]ARQ92321.1 flippase [Levilactobacillus brevis]
MRVVRNYLYNVFYQVFILIIPLITTPYLSRILGPTGIGINSYTNSIIQYFILFGSVGVNLYGNRQIAYVRQDRIKLTRTFYEIYFMRLVTIIIAYMCFIVFVSLVGKFRFYYFAQSISIIAAAFDISWFFMGIENFAVTVLRNFIIKLITLISIFVFVKDSSDLFVYILILSLSLLIGNMTLFPSLRKYVGKLPINELKIWHHFIPSAILFLPQIATQIYLVVNKTMLGAMTSIQAAGFFDQSDKIIKMVLAIVTATGTVMLPHVANAFSRGKIEKTKQYIYVSFEFVTAISIPLAFGLAAVSNKFVPMFFSSRFVAVVPLMMIESLVIILIAWSNALGTQYLLPTQQVKSYSTSVIIGAVVNIIINIPLIIFWGAIGTAIATVLSELSVTIYQLIAVKNQLVLRKLFINTDKYFSSGVVMFFIVFCMDTFLSAQWKWLALEILVGCMVYILMLLLLRVHVVDKMKNVLFK